MPFNAGIAEIRRRPQRLSNQRGGRVEITIRNEPLQLISTPRSREKITLTVFTFQLPQQSQPIFSLDTLSNHIHPAALGQRHDRANNREVLFMLHHLRHKRSIDLQRVDGEALKVTQARISSSKVVDTQLHAELS